MRTCPLCGARTLGATLLATKLAVPCCAEDADNDGKCDRHPGGIYEVDFDPPKKRKTAVARAASGEASS